MNQLSALLKLGRRRKQLSQLELANMLNIQEKTYGTYERGTREPTFDLLLALIKILELGPEMGELMGSLQNVGSSSKIPQPSPDASLLDLVTALRELQLAEEKIQDRIDHLIGPRKGSVKTEKNQDRSDTDKQSKGDTPGKVKKGKA